MPLNAKLDLIAACLSLVPVPYLDAAFTALGFIWQYVQQAQASKRQLKLLTQYIAELLHALDGEYRAGRLAKSASSNAALARLMK